MAFAVHHLLAQSAARSPEAEAVRFLGESITYGELDERSNRLAHALIAGGVRRGDRVGIHLPKSIDTIVSVYGIMKAGACYVPVDPSAPPSRLHNIAVRCAFSSLVTNAALGARIAPTFAAQCPMRTVFCTDAAAEFPAEAFSFAQLSEFSSAAPDVNVIDDDLAYILFTSGSTGTPKGVMLSHLNALTFVNWGYSTFGARPEDRFSNHAPLNFDLSTFDLFVACRAGAALCLVPERLSAFPVRLSSFIETELISVWYSVPMVLTMLLNHGQLEERDLSKLRLILFAGEVFPTKHLRALMQKLPDRRYVNLYGPTETNVCTWYDVLPIPENQTNPIPIGVGCANTDAFAIDDEGNRISKPGIEGMLHVRGSTVMQGYFGDPEASKTCLSKKMLPNGREETVYCTGDRVMLDERGNFHFLGRADHMIKTRGYRVELGEIETALMAHPEVKDAVAVPVSDELLGHKIVAYVTPNGAGSIQANGLKDHCCSVLPHYMVPEHIEFRDSLPRTGNGKIDRKLLATEAATTLCPASGGRP